MQVSIPDYILFEDDYILVVNKPAGLMIEPDRNNHINLLHLVQAYLKSSVPSQEELYAQHINRLDRPVSGIVLFAKKRTVLKNLSEQFAERRVKKFYRALTNSMPEKLQDRLEHWHRKEKKKAVLYTEQIEYTEKAILDYTISTISANKHLWSIELLTGKYHQIRAQLASLNCPIIGDSLYGSSSDFKPNAIALQGYRLIFHHPVTNQEMDICLPDNF